MVSLACRNELLATRCSRVSIVCNGTDIVRRITRLPSIDALGTDQQRDSNIATALVELAAVKRSVTRKVLLAHLAKEDVEVRHSVVWGCSEQLSTIFHAKNVRIHDTLFRDNGPDLLRGFNLGRAQLQMQRVTIRDNHCGEPMDGYGTLFSDDSEYPDLPGVTDHGAPKVRVKGPQGVRVTFEDGVIRDNRFSALSDTAKTVDVRRSTLERSGWD